MYSTYFYSPLLIGIVVSHKHANSPQSTLFRPGPIKHSELNPVVDMTSLWSVLFFSSQHNLSLHNILFLDLWAWCSSHWFCFQHWSVFQHFGFVITWMKSRELLFLSNFETFAQISSACTFQFINWFYSLIMYSVYTTKECSHDAQK